MKLNYTDQGSGAAVVLMHGMFGSLSNLGSLAKVLAQRYRVLSVDLRNHGDSPHEDEMDLALMASDVVELLDALNLPRAILLGHSLGGKIAMQVALNHPQRVSQLIVADISPVNYPQTNNAPVLDGLSALGRVQVISRRAADELLAEYVPDLMTRSFLLKNLVRKADGEFGLKLNMDSISKNYATSLVAAPSGEPFDGPILFLKGESSAYIQEKHQPVIKAFFPNFELQVISEVGHWLHAEKPDVFNNLVTDFLDANS